jgi:Subtilase family
MTSPRPNFILGFGERLADSIAAPTSGAAKKAAYTADESIERLTPMIDHTVAAFDQLPQLACPNDEVVGVITLHPEWIAKSYFPQQLLDATSLKAIGSKPTQVTPEKWTRKGEPESRPTTDLFVAGRRVAFREWRDGIGGYQPDQLGRVESIRPYTASERLKPGVESAENDFLEVVLHSPADRGDAIVNAFKLYAQSIGIEPLVPRRVKVGGLCFLPVPASIEQAEELSLFSFVRTARPLPRLRELGPIERSAPASVAECPLPDLDPVDPNVSVAVFDGGIVDSELMRWVDAHEPQGVGPPVPLLRSHGHSVTSALLFGPLVPGKTPAQPFTRVHNYRVLDRDMLRDPLELFDVLARIVSVLEQRPYEFVNISMGPRLSVDDDDVHVWTAKLDEIWSTGTMLASVAVGNTGCADRQSGNARIQVPSDSVNSLAVGAANSSTNDWERADYSSIGPGRSPGIVKPDVVNFGGGDTEPFYVYGADAPSIEEIRGTSFAAPATLRLATGVRAHFGEYLTPVALKALLVNTAQCDSRHDRAEVGWGKVARDLDGVVVCPDGVVRVVYQSRLRPGGWIRARLPLPDGDIEGMVGIAATFCFFAPVDPQDPGNYTQAGLEVVFRPHAETFKDDDAVNPQTKSFFKRSDYMYEDELRTDAHKWETTLHHYQRFRSTSLLRPSFDIHYNARAGGSTIQAADELNYALVVSISSPRTPDLYNRVVTTYASQLEVLNPAIEIAVTT